MLRALPLLIVLALAAPSAAATAPAATTPAVKLISDRKPAERPSLMVLGVSHFDNPARDVVNVKVDDVLSSKRQKEMADLARAIERFRPTRVVVEWPADKQAKLDARYADYRAGRYQLTRDERDQLGLRIAADLKLDRVIAADWNEEPPGQDADYDFTVYPDTPEAKARFARLSDPAQASEDSRRLRESTLRSYLAWMNRPEHLAWMHSRYFDFALIGDAKKNPGANWVMGWYGRNLKIFDNLVWLTDDPHERILVIYGAGHAHLLRQFARESGAFKVVDPVTYLAPARPSRPPRTS
jgi:hypothetical protein